MSGEWLTFLLIAVVAAGFGMGAYSIAQSPKFYVQLALELLPLFKGVFARMSPEDEKKLQQATRRGEEWDNFRKRPRDK